MWPFWRHGFLSWYGRRLETSDYTCIPRYDLTFQEVSSWRPYWQNVGIEAFWDLLLSPYRRLPTAHEIYPEALNRAAELLAAEQAEPPASELDPEPFL